MPKQFDVTISIPLHLFNDETPNQALKTAQTWAKKLCAPLRGTCVYDEAEQPIIEIRRDGELYKVCPICGNLCADVDDVHDPDSDHEQAVCFQCHCDMLDSGEITMCEACGQYFHGNRLNENPENGENELCPYCGKVWCD